MSFMGLLGRSPHMSRVGGVFFLLNSRWSPHQQFHSCGKCFLFAFCALQLIYKALNVAVWSSRSFPRTKLLCSQTMFFTKNDGHEQGPCHVGASLDRNQRSGMHGLFLPDSAVSCSHASALAAADRAHAALPVDIEDLSCWGRHGCGSGNGQVHPPPPLFFPAPFSRHMLRCTPSIAPQSRLPCVNSACRVVEIWRLYILLQEHYSCCSPVYEGPLILSWGSASKKELSSTKCGLQCGENKHTINQVTRLSRHSEWL